MKKVLLITFLIFLNSTLWSLPPNKDDYVPVDKKDDPDVRQRLREDIDKDFRTFRPHFFANFMKQHQISGPLACEEVDFLGNKFTSIICDYYVKDGIMRFDNIKGSGLGTGSVTGELYIDYHTMPPSFGMEYSIKNALLSEMFDSKLKEKQKMEGLVDFDFFLFVGPTIKGNLFGEGHAEIKNGKFAELPLMLGIIDFLGVPKFEDITFNRGHFDYTVTLDGIYIKNLTLQSDRISIIKGEGLFRYDRSIDIVCSIRTEMKVMGKIPILGKVFRSAYNTFLKGLMTVRIQGKMEDPKVSVIPLGVGRKAKAYNGPRYKYERHDSADDKKIKSTPLKPYKPKTRFSRTDTL